MQRVELAETVAGAYTVLSFAYAESPRKERSSRLTPLLSLLPTARSSRFAPGQTPEKFRYHPSSKNSCEHGRLPISGGRWDHVRCRRRVSLCGQWASQGRRAHRAFWTRKSSRMNRTMRRELSESGVAGAIGATRMALA